MMKQMMAAGAGGSNTAAADSVPMTLEVSAKHPVIKTLYSIKQSNADVAKLSVELLFDNACIAAGMLDEPRSVLPRLNKILETMVMQGAGYDYGKKAYQQVEGASASGTADNDTAASSTTETSATSASSDPTVSNPVDGSGSKVAMGSTE